MLSFNGFKKDLCKTLSVPEFTQNIYSSRSINVSKQTSQVSDKNRCVYACNSNTSCLSLLMLSPSVCAAANNNKKQTHSSPLFIWRSTNQGDKISVSVGELDWWSSKNVHCFLISQVIRIAYFIFDNNKNKGNFRSILSRNVWKMFLHLLGVCGLKLAHMHKTVMYSRV